VGYGPRFLHSTGQLHKGDAGKGLFIQIISRMDIDAPIPDQAGVDKSRMSFGTLITAQAFGDRQALLAGGRRVITFRLDTDQETGCTALSELLANDRFVPGIMA
jgi:transaldolase/glucose-6-phosphate isomerase